MSSHPEVIVVGALATKVSNIAPFRYTAEHIAEDATSIHYVHGGLENQDGTLQVATPSEQAAQINAVIEQYCEKDILIISQSMGALAALACVEQSSSRVKAISASPPLLYPSDVIRHPRILTRSRISNGQLFLPSYSFALGEAGPSAQPPTPVELAVTPELFNEIDTINGEYWDRTIAAIEADKLRIVMPTEDWNQAALNSSRQLAHVEYLQGPHSLITEQTLLQKNIGAIARLASSFKPTA